MDYHLCPGGLVSPSGEFASLLFDQVGHFASIKLCQASWMWLPFSRYMSLSLLFSSSIHPLRILCAYLHDKITEKAQTTMAKKNTFFYGYLSPFKLCHHIRMIWLCLLFPYFHDICRGKTIWLHQGTLSAYHSSESFQFP